jgi:sulfur carrier protein
MQNVIDIVVNGEQKSVEEGITIAGFLKQLDISSRGVAVEVNQQIRPRDTHHQTLLHQGDVLEIVTLVGGG